MPRETTAAQPLRGYRVLDLTNVLAGPFASHQLAHLGAEVVKIEVPGAGDLARQLGADPKLNRQGMGVSFLAQNSGKRSVALDLKAAEGKTLLKRLARTADVLVENFRPGVMDRLGLGWETLRQENPDLVYCAVSGFGQDGPLSGAPAYDQIVQGLSGVMSITGAPEAGPLRVGYPVADTLGGLTAAFAISAALAKGKPGRGTFIDVSMLDAVLSAMGWVVSNHLTAGQEPVRMGNDNFTASPSGTFRAKGSLLNIAANKQEQWEALAHILGRPDLASDPRFADRQSRLENRAELTVELEAALASRTAAEWVAALTAGNVPAGEVLTVPEALAHPQVTGRDLVATFETPGADRPVRLARPGFRMDGARPATASPPPALGADTEAVLGELGLSAGEIAGLRDKGVIG
jgi:crotonobetainyl-CoA:carnitine CoA-transferase CaiB-like acyl-CoA transferase